MYLPQLACCAGNLSPYVVCQRQWRVGGGTIVCVPEQLVVVYLYVEVCTCWVILGWGGVPSVPACCGTMGTSVVGGRWHRSGTACAWGRNLGLYLQGGPYIWGSPLGIAHLHQRSLFLRQCCCPVVGGVVSPVGTAEGRRESLSPCLLVVWFASLGLLVWVELVPGWAPCPHPVSGHGPSSLVLGRGGYIDVVFCGSFCAVVRSRHVPRCPHRAALGVRFPELRGYVARPSGSCLCVVLS